jgi:hypothetical protein
MTHDAATDLLTVNDEFSVSLVIVRCRRTASGAFLWLVRLDTGLNPDLTIAIRMGGDNREPLDYYLLPAIDMTAEKLRLAEDNGLSLDTYRFDDLEFFYGMALRTKLKEAA